MSASLGNPAPAMDSIEIEDSASKFGQAKQDARKMFNSIASEGLSICADAASFRRWLDDAEVNARNRYLARKDPAWDHVFPAKDLETGREWLEPGEAELLAQKREYERNLKNLDVRFPARKQFWLERYARESTEKGKLAQAVRQAIDARPAGTPTGPSEADRSDRKGDVTLLQRADGSRNESVDFPTLEKYAGISPRRDEKEQPSELLSSVAATANPNTGDVPARRQHLAYETAEDSVFRKEGESWRLVFSGREVRVNDRKGLGYIANILRSPGKAFYCAEFLAAVHDGPLPTLGSAGESLDSAAFENYRSRVEDLEDQLAEANRNHRQGQSLVEVRL